VKIWVLLELFYLHFDWMRVKFCLSFIEFWFWFIWKWIEKLRIFRVKKTDLGRNKLDSYNNLRVHWPKFSRKKWFKNKSDALSVVFLTTFMSILSSRLLFFYKILSPHHKITVWRNCAIRNRKFLLGKKKTKNRIKNLGWKRKKGYFTFGDFLFVKVMFFFVWQILRFIQILCGWLKHIFYTEIIV
jgi:hypothetical protein